MIRFRLIIFVTVMVLIGALQLSHAQVPKSLDLQTAMDLAWENQPELAVEKAGIGLLDADILTAGSRPNPTVMSDNGTAERTYRLGLTQMLELGGKRRNRIAVAKAERTAAVAKLENSRLELRAEVREVYTRLYALQQRLMVLKELLAKQKNTASQLASSPDANLMKVALAQAENQFDTFNWQARKAQQRLNYLMNVPLETVYTLTPPHNPVLDKTLQEYINLAMSKRPEFAALKARQGVLTQSLKLAKANRVPDLRLAVGPDWITSPGSGGNIVGVFAMADVAIPVFNRMQGPIQKAEVRQAQLLLEHTALGKKLGLEVTQAYEAVQYYQGLLNRYETSMLPMSAENLKTSGTFIAFQEYMDLQFEYLQTLLDAQGAISDLEAAALAGVI